MRMVQHAAAEDEGIAGFEHRPQPVALGGWRAQTSASARAASGSSVRPVAAGELDAGASAPQGVSAIQQVTIGSKAPSVEVAPRKSKPRAPS